MPGSHEGFAVSFVPRCFLVPVRAAPRSCSFLNQGTEFFWLMKKFDDNLGDCAAAAFTFLQIFFVACINWSMEPKMLGQNCAVRSPTKRMHRPDNALQAAALWRPFDSSRTVLGGFVSTIRSSDSRSALVSL